jgi:hypothetical protein
LTLPSKEEMGSTHLEFYVDVSGSMRDFIVGSHPMSYVSTQTLQLGPSKEDVFTVHNEMLQSKGTIVRVGIISALYTELFRNYDCTFRFVCYSDSIKYISEISELTIPNIRRYGQELLNVSLGGGTKMISAFKSTKEIVSTIPKERNILIMALTDGFDFSHCKGMNRHYLTPGEKDVLLEELESLKKDHSIRMITMGIGKPDIDFSKETVCNLTDIPYIKSKQKPLYGMDRDSMNTCCIQSFAKAISKLEDYGTIKASVPEGAYLSTIWNELDISDLTSYIICNVSPTGTPITLECDDGSMETIKGMGCTSDYSSNEPQLVEGLTRYYKQYVKITERIDALTKAYKNYEEELDRAMSDLQRSRSIALSLHSINNTSDSGIIMYHARLYLHNLDKIIDKVSLTSKAKSSERDEEDIKDEETIQSIPMPPPYPLLFPPPPTLRREVGSMKGRHIIPDAPKLSEDAIDAIKSEMKEMEDNIRKDAIAKIKEILSISREMLTEIYIDTIDKPKRLEEEYPHLVDNHHLKTMNSICYTKFCDYRALKFTMAKTQEHRTIDLDTSPVVPPRPPRLEYHNSTGGAVLRCVSSGIGRAQSEGINSQLTPLCRDIPDRVITDCEGTNEPSNYITCNICLTNTADTIFNPCSHSHLCTECYGTLLATKGSITCPTCRCSVDSVIDVKKDHLTNRLECINCLEVPRYIETLPFLDEGEGEGECDDEEEKIGEKKKRIIYRACIVHLACGHLSVCGACHEKSVNKDECIFCKEKSPAIKIYV